MAVSAYETPTCFLAQTTTIAGRKHGTVMVPGTKAATNATLAVVAVRIGRSGVGGKEDREASHRRVCGLGVRKEGRKEGSAGLARHETIYGCWKQCCRRPTKGAATLRRSAPAEPPLPRQS